MSRFEEVRLLLQTLKAEYGSDGEAQRGAPFVDGREAILEMKEKNWRRWREVEWPGYFIKFKCIENIQDNYSDRFEIIQRGKLHLFEGKTLWDVRFNPYGRHGGAVPMMGHPNLNWVLDEYSGLGLIAINSIVSYDDRGDFWEWHERLKGGLSDYSQERIEEERQRWRRKESFMIIDAHAWYLSKDDVERGESDGWLKEHYQSSARQADGGPRTGKYKALLFGIPDRCYEGHINFNVVPEDWEDEEEEDE